MTGQPDDACPACGLPADHEYHVDHPGGAGWLRYNHRQLLAAYRNGRTDEREACAQLANERHAVWYQDDDPSYDQQPFADLIRARTPKETTP